MRLIELVRSRREGNFYILIAVIKFENLLVAGKIQWGVRDCTPARGTAAVAQIGPMLVYSPAP